MVRLPGDARVVVMAKLPCAPKACAACPWRKSNQGKQHAHGWYSQANLDRLWRGLRTGEAPGMTCHPTDPDNLVPEGHRAPPDDSQKHECAGSLILVIRELRAIEADPKSYPRRFPFLSKSGVLWWAFSRSVFAGTLLGSDPLPLLEDDPEIYYAPLAKARS